MTRKHLLLVGILLILDQASPIRAEVTDVWVVFKTHCDIGYTDTVENVLTKYRVQMMEGAIAVFDQERNQPPEKRFSWTIAGWPLTHIIGPKQEPARRARIEQAIREGALVVHALPFTMHTETYDLEDLVRGLRFSSAIARKYGQPLPIAAKMTDVPSHSWVLPTLLAHAGVKFLQIGSNDNSGHLQIPSLFWWESADGSRILCNYTATYGSGIVPPPNWPSKNYLAMIMTYDNQGPPSAADVEKIRQQAQRTMPGVRIHFATLDAFAKAVGDEKPELPVVRGDMPDTWIHGFMSMPIESKTVRNLRPLEPALEALDTQLRAWGLAPKPLAPALADAYEQSALYSEHTWGPSGPKGGPWENGLPKREYYGEEWKAFYAKGVYKPFEAGFDDHRIYARKADQIVRRELRSRLDLLARSVQADGPRIVVYNGLPWKRSGMVEIPGQPGHFLLAADVPANGYRTYAFAAEAPVTSSTAATTLDTPFYKVTFDLRRGGIASLVEKKTGRQLVDQSSPYVLGQYLHERFDAPRMHEFLMAYSRPPGGAAEAFMHFDTPKDLVYGTKTPTGWRLAVQRGTVADIAMLTAADTVGLAKGIMLVITLGRDQPSLDIEWRVDDKTADPIPEGGWLCFPLDVQQPRYTLGRLGAPIDPARDILPGANKDYFCLSTGLLVTGKDRSGIGLCPIDSPCVSLGEPGLWKYSSNFRPKRPTVFVNLYNNEWATNFPYWIGGSWSSRVRLWTTQGDAPGAQLCIPAWEARLPLLPASAEGAAGSLPMVQPGLSVSRPGVLVTAFGADPDGINPGTLLRVWDQSGVSGRLTITLPEGFTAVAAQPVNLRGEKNGRLIAVEGRTFAFALNAFAPASFILGR